MQPDEKDVITCHLKEDDPRLEEMYLQPNFCL